MKRIFLVLAILFSILVVGSQSQINVKAAESVEISVDNRLAISFVKGTEGPSDFKRYFVLRVDGARVPLTDDQIDNGGFDINTVGDYTVKASATVEGITATNQIVLSVIESDIEGPEITVNRPFLEVKNENGDVVTDENGNPKIAWDARESMESLMTRFTFYDKVDGLIVPNQFMFEGIERVRLYQFDEEFEITLKASDKAGNVTEYGTFTLVIIKSIGSVLIDVNEDFPVEFIVNSDAPDFRQYFKVTDNVDVIEDFQLRLGGFDITKVGEYTVSAFYARPYVFNQNQDLKRVSINVKVIENDLTAPEISTFEVLDKLTPEGKFLWTYNEPLSKFTSRFSVIDNVDGRIQITDDMFEGLDKVDIKALNEEYLITFRVKDGSGNESFVEVNMVVVDNVAPYITNFQNRYYSLGTKLNILEVANEVHINDNYENNESVLKIVLNGLKSTDGSKELFKQVKMSYHDLEKYKDRFTEEQLKSAAQAYTYMLEDGAYTVTVQAFRSDDIDKLLAKKELTITVVDGMIEGLNELYQQLDLEYNEGLIMYYVTNYEPGKNGEYVMFSYGLDKSENAAPYRPLRIVIENGPSLALIIIIINAVSIGVFAIGVGLFFGVKAVKRKEKEA